MTTDAKALDLLRDSVRRFVAERVTPHVLEWERNGTVPRSLFREAGELGFLGLRLSVDHGGSGLDFRATRVLIQELMRCGSVGVTVSLLAHMEFATREIDVAGSDELRTEIVRPAAEGRLIGALGVTEPDAGSDVAAIRTRAVRDGDAYVIDGAKLYTTNGTIADFVTTAVRTGGPGHRGISLIVVPTATPGLSARRLEKIGAHASDTAEIAFQGCRVPARYLIGEENGGFRLILHGFESERLVLAVIACSHMRLMWEEAKRFGHERRAFGRPLLAFQTWRHRLADALTTIEAAEALTERAIERQVRGLSCNSEAAMAKLFATEAVTSVAPVCTQIFGGLGLMEESLIGRLARDSIGFTVGAGTSEIMREIIAAGAGLEPERSGSE